MFLSMTMALPRSFTIRSSLGKLKATVWGPFTSCKSIFHLSQFLSYKSPIIDKSGHGGHHWEIIFSCTSFRICGSQQFNELETAQNALLRDSGVKEITHFEISASQEVMTSHTFITTPEGSKSWKAHTPLLNSNRMTRIGEAETPFDLYSEAIGKLSSSSCKTDISVTYFPKCRPHESLNWHNSAINKLT